MSLYPTPHRKAFLRAVNQPSRIYREAGQAWDAREGCKVTSRLAEAFSAGWVKACEAHERPPHGLSTRVYFRLTDAGERAMRSTQ